MQFAQELTAGDWEIASFVNVVNQSASGAQ